MTTPIGDYLRSLRRDRKLTLREVEKATGLSNPYLSQLETGKVASPSAQVLGKLAAFYGVEPGAMMSSACRPPEPPPSPPEDAAERAAAEWGPTSQNHDPSFIAFARACYAEGYRAGMDSSGPTEASPEPRYGILVQHDESIDQYLRTERRHYTDESMNGWTTDRDEEIRRFATIDEARAVADEFMARFGTKEHRWQRYRFSVIECRMVPRWFLIEPRNEREQRPVGSVEQL